MARVAVAATAVAAREVTARGAAAGTGAVPADDDDVVMDPDHVDVGAVQGAEGLGG
jgi:hypothetical protein